MGVEYNGPTPKTLALSLGSETMGLVHSGSGVQWANPYNPGPKPGMGHIWPGTQWEWNTMGQPLKL